MRTPSRSRGSAIALLALIVAAAVGLAGSAQAGVDGQTLVFDLTGSSRPTYTIAGDRYISYTMFTGVAPNQQSDLWLYDTQTGAHIPFVANPTVNEGWGVPRGELVAYIADPDQNDKASVFVRRSNGSIVGEWNYAPQAAMGAIDMWGDKVVYSCDIDGDGNPDVGYFDIDSPGGLTRLSSGSDSASYPSIWRDVVVWHTSPPGADGEVILRHLDSNVSIPITDDAIGQVTADIWGEWVAWAESLSPSGPVRVVAQSLITGERRIMEHAGEYSLGPSVFADTVSYMTFSLSTGDVRVYTYDLVSGERHTVWQSNGRANELPTSFWGAHVTWWDIGTGGTVTDTDAHAARLHRSLDVEQLEGPDRYDTAVQISKASYAGGLQGVVVATGENFPDALAGSALAGAVGGPILITRTDSLPPQIATELARLNPTDVYVLGGPGAVSDGVFTAIQAAVPGANVRRIAGADRYETAREVAKECQTQLLAVTDAFVATGQNFPDALAASPVAAALGVPIFLAEGDAISETTVAEMQTLGIQRVYMLGGASVVTPATQQRLEAAFGAGNVARLEGPTRYETAQAIGDWAVEDMPYLEWSGVTMATGENFPDALTGGVLAGQRGTVMLLTHTASLTPSTRAKLEEHDVYDIPRVTFFGGDGAISHAVIAGVRGALQ